jgi:hypothetical protein
MQCLAVLLALVSALPLAAQANDRVLSPDTLFFPEGIGADPRTGTLFVTSIHHRSVLAVAPGGAARWLFDAAAARTAGVTGIVVDTARDLAWIATARHPQMRPLPGDSAVRGELIAVRLSDGRLVERHTLGDGTSIAGELTLTPSGEVLVSDGLLGVLYRLARGARTLHTVRSTALRSPQGLAVSANGHTAYIADWSRGLLLWDLATDSIASLRIEPTVPLRGIDGLVRVGHTLLMIYNGGATPRVIAATLTPDGRAATGLRDFDAPSAYPGEPTVGTILDGRYVYITSSAWPFYTEAGVRRPDARALPPLTVRAVPLPPALAR